MRSGRLVGAAETSKEPTDWHRFSWKNLRILNLLKRKEGSQCNRGSSWQVRQKEKEIPLPKGKGTEPFVQSTRLCDGRESSWARAAPRQEGGRS